MPDHGLNLVGVSAADAWVPPPPRAAAEQAPTREPHDLRQSRNPGDILLRVTTGVAALLILAIFGLMFIGLLIRSWPSITQFGMSFFTMAPSNQIPFGPNASIIGTVKSSVVALLLAGPFSVLIAIFLTQMSPVHLRLPLGFLVELLAAIPSIVYGLWALFVLVPAVGINVNQYLTNHAGSFGLFASASTSGQGLIVASLILAIMILPTIAAISRDVLSTVPASQREGMLALGATRWETTWRVVVPYARTGIIGAMALGLGRALGETMAVQLVIGGIQQNSGWSIASLATTIPSTIVYQFQDAFGVFQAALMELALVLLIITVALNAIARMLVWSVTRRYAT